MLFVFNLLLQFSTSIRVIVDQKNFKSLVDMSFSLPVFIVFYSPYCGHCQRMHPDWIQFMERYKDDPYIVAAEINCIEFRKEAGTLMSISGYPTFAVVNNGKGSQVSVTRTTKDFCAKAEELKILYPPKSQSRVKCHFFKNNADDIKYPYMTLLSSYITTQADQDSKNIIRGIDDVCKMLEKVSVNTGISLDNLLINQTSIVVKPTEFILKSNSIVISKAFINPTKSIEYKFTIGNNNDSMSNNTNINNFFNNSFNNASKNSDNSSLNNNLIDYNNTNISHEMIYNMDSISLFANEYLKYTQFGDWDIINNKNAENFAFRTSKRRLLLFVFKSNNEASHQAAENDMSLSNRVVMNYKATSMNNAEHFLINKISSKQLYDKWGIKLSTQSEKSDSSQIDLICSNPAKTHFTLIRDIESLNIQEVFKNISLGLFDTQNNNELAKLNKIYGSTNSGIIRRGIQKERKSPLLFFALGYLFFAVLITVGIWVYLLVNDDQNSTTTDSGTLIDHGENEIDNNVDDNCDNILKIESDDNDDTETPVKSE